MVRLGLGAEQKTFGGLRRVESLGEWRASGVLLHLPFGDSGHPGIVGPAVGMSAEGCFEPFVRCRLRAAAGNKYIGYPAPALEQTFVQSLVLV